MKTKQNRWKIHILALSLKNRQCGISTFKIEIKDIIKKSYIYQSHCT